MFFTRDSSHIEDFFVFLRHRHRIYIMENKDLNRIKVMLAEKKRTNKWLVGELAKTLQQFLNGLQTPLSQVWKILSRFQNYSKLILKNLYVSNLKAYNYDQIRDFV